MSWKPNKVGLYSPERNLVGTKNIEELQDLPVVKHEPQQQQLPPRVALQQPALPLHPIKLEPTTVLLAKTTAPPCPLPNTSLSDEALAMPPPPVPPPPPSQPRTPVSPPTSVSSTSNEDCCNGSNNDRSDIGT